MAHRPIDEYIDVIEDSTNRRLPPRHPSKALVCVARVDQDVLASAHAKLLDQSPESLRLVEGLASDDGDSIALEAGIKQCSRQAINADEGTGVRIPAVRRDTASYLQCGRAASPVPGYEHARCDESRATALGRYVRDA